MAARSAILAAAMLLGNAATAAPTHCTGKEKIIFSCPLGAKTVSVCASGDLSAGLGSLSYRFGPPGQPEMTYPPNAWRGVTRSGMMAFSGGGGAFLAFHRDDFRYVVYTAIGKGFDKAGVAVEQNGKRLTNQPCRGKPDSELGPDFFAASNIAEDSAPFELP